MKTHRKLSQCDVDKFTLPLFPIAGPRTCHAVTPRAQSVIETIRKSCDIDEDGHWIWRGKVRSYGAPCMTYQQVTRPVRQVLYSLIGEEHPLGLPLLPRCGNPRCVAPECICPKRHAELMTEARARKAKSAIQIPCHQGMWGQLMNSRGE